MSSTNDQFLVKLDGTVYTVTGDSILSTDVPFSLPSGYTFIIPQGITLTINGSFRWNGELIVHGTLINNTSTVSNKSYAITIVDGAIQNNGALLIPNLSLEVSGNIVTTATIVCSGNNKLTGTIDLQGSATITMSTNSTTVVSGTINLPSAAALTNDGDATINGSIVGGGTINNNGSINATATATITATVTGNPIELQTATSTEELYSGAI